tara:strand:+ start:149 stop:394 length:246 start_codon:yes stop_codon:yes gene_type:complete
MTEKTTIEGMKKFLELVTQIDILRFKLDDLLPDLKEALEEDEDDENGFEIVDDFIDNRMDELENIGNNVQAALEEWLKEHP